MNSSTLEEIRLAVRLGNHVPSATVARWLNTANTTVLTCLAHAFAAKCDLFDCNSFGLISDALVEHLVLAASRTDYCAELSQGEALEYLRCVFWICWNAKPRPQETLKKIRASLETMVCGWPECGNDLVLLVVLEHVFIDPCVQKFFSSWNADPLLREAFMESVRLSEGCK